MYLLSCHLGILDDLLHRIYGRFEGNGIDLFKLGTCDVGREIFALEQRIDLDSGLGDATESALCTFASASQAADSTGIFRDIQLALLLEFLLEVVKQGVVEVLSSQVSIASGGLDGEDTTSDVEEGDIESASTQVEDKNVLLGLGLLVETVGDGSCSGLVDDTEDVETSDCASVLGGEALGVVEISGNAGYVVVR